MAFEIETLDKAKEKREAGIEFAFLDPKKGEETGAYITVASYSSERVKSRARSIAKEWEKRKQRNPNYLPGIDEQERLTMAMAHAVVLSWRGFILSGEEWPCTPENIERLLSDPSAAKQVDEAAGDDTRFFGV